MPIMAISLAIIHNAKQETLLAKHSSSHNPLACPSNFDSSSLFEFYSSSVKGSCLTLPFTWVYMGDKGQSSLPIQVTSLVKGE